MQLRARTGLAAALTASLALSPTLAYAADPVTGRQRTLVVIVDFKDAKHSDIGFVKDQVRKSYFTGSSSLAGYYDKVSQGAFTYVPAVPEKVVGPFQLDLSQNPCDAGALNAATVAVLKERDFEEGEDYDSLSIVEPGTNNPCSWSGLGTMPGTTTWINLADGMAIDETVLIHEFGHNHGLAHQGREVCTEGDLSRCWSNDISRKSPMGGGGQGYGLAAPELISRGWLPGGQAVTVTKSATYSLRPLYGGKEGGVRALDIPFGKDRLVVEYRRADPSYTNGAGVLDAAAEGVYAYRVPDGRYDKSSLLDPTETPGDSITRLADAASRTEIRVGKSENGAALVTVNLNGVEAPPAPVAHRADAEAPAPRRSAADGQPASETGTDAAHAPGKAARSSAAPSSTATPSAADDRTAAPAQTPRNHDPLLAETGGSSVTPLLAGAGAALTALGATLFLLRRRRNRHS